MKEALDDMMVHYDGPGAKFDGNFYRQLMECFDKYDDKIMRKS